MRSRGLVRRGLPGLVGMGLFAMTLPLNGSAQAGPPVVTVSPTGAKIKVTQASLAEAIDALAKAAGFKVTYEGARPNAVLFNTEIDTPSVAQTLFRLIDGQNLNYAAKFDLTGKNVTALMVLGTQSKAAGTTGAPAGASRPQPFAPPRAPRNDLPVVDDDPVEAEPEPTAQPLPTPAPASASPPRNGPGGQATPYPPSPFAPRPPFGSPFGPRSAPSPSPSP